MLMPNTATLLNISVSLIGCRQNKYGGVFTSTLIVSALSLCLLQIVHSVSAAEPDPSQRRDYEDRLCHAAPQPDKIQHDLCVLLMAMAIQKL